MHQINMTATAQGLCLGIDLGTTSVKVSLLEQTSRKLLFNTSEPTEATVPVTCCSSNLGSEQNVSKILKAVINCLMRITDRNRALIKCISICGQMHGVLLWNSDTQVTIKDDLLLPMDTSNLFTWQDKRASELFISELQTPDSHQKVASGFGCVTLFWLRRNEPGMLVKYNVVGSIMDYVITLMCGLDKPVMGHQIATSFGYFNATTNTWNLEILKNAGFPVHLLPVVAQSGSRAGELCTDWLGIPKGTPVLVGLGDMQCSFLSASQHPTDAVLNMSTSCQLSYEICSSGFQPRHQDTPSPVSYFPYFDGRFLAVAASLNGGNVLTAFVKMIQQWFSVFDITMDDATIWDKLRTISTKTDTSLPSPITLPVIYGERHNPTVTASVSHITDHNMSLDTVYQSVCEGLVKNLHTMMPCCVLIESGISRVVVSGSVIDRHECVRDSVRKMYGLVDVVVGTGADSALGAAIVACKHLDR